MTDETARERFLGWTEEQLVDEIIRLEDALIKQASLAECAWCGELLPKDKAPAHVKSCAVRPPEAR